MKFPNKLVLVRLVILLLLIGCSAEDPVVIQHRSALLMSTEPAGSVTIEDARSNIESETQIVLTGRIGTPDLTNWWSTTDDATIFISEGMPDSHYNPGDGHDPASCPFCKRKWKLEDSMAIVRFVDKSGQQIPVGANKLLDVKDGDVVVVKGVASLDESGYLIVEASGLLIR